MQPFKETAEWSRKQSEERIVAALKEAQFKTEDGGLTFGELANDIGSSTRTISRALKRLRKRKVIDVKPVERRGRYTTLYFLTRFAEKGYPHVGISRRHYEELAHKFDDTIPPKQFIDQLNLAITRSFVENWIVAKRGKKQLTFEAVQAVMNNFDFLLKKYIFYRKNQEALTDISNIQPSRNRLNLLMNLLRNVDLVDLKPDEFSAQFEELREALEDAQ